MKKDNRTAVEPIVQDPPKKREEVGLEESTATETRESLIISVEELNDETQMNQDNRDAVVSSVEQTQEEKQENDPSNEAIPAQYVVCKGATCNCDGNPSAKGTLEVTTHKKYYINDQGTDKPVATVEDVMFKGGVSPFITCSHKKGNDKTCTYAPQGKWKVPNNAKFPEVGGKDILTELGTLGCAIGGTLTIMTHGQTVDVDDEDVQEVEDAFVDISAINALLSYEDLPSEEQKYPEEYVSDVSKLECTPSEDVVLTSYSEGNTSAFYVLKGQFVDFRAIVSVNTADKHKRRGDNISWGITEILSEDVFIGAKSSSSKTYKLQEVDQNKVVYTAFKRVMNPFGFAFAKSGTYIIDASSREKVAGSEWAYYKDQYCYIEVVDQASIIALSLKGINQEIFIGNEVTITVISNLPLSSTTLSSLTITIASVSITGEESTLYSYRDSSIESMVNSKRYTQTANKLEAKFSCLNSGLFTIKVLQDGQELTALSQSMEVLENKVIDIQYVEGRIRRGTQASYQAILKNGNTVDETKIKWRIRSPHGRTYGEEKVGETGVFVFKELGKYTLQCLYGSRLFFDQEKVQKQIEVIDNKIEGVTVQHAMAKEEGKNYTVFVNQRAVVHINTLLGYLYEAVAPIANTSALNFHASKEEALAYINANKSKKDPLLLYSISYLGKGANQTEGEIKLSRESTKKIGSTPIYFTASTAALDLTLCNEGMYFLNVQLGHDTPVEVVLNSSKGRIKQWFFHDGKHKTARIGYKQNFGITATVEGWANKKGKLHIWWDNRTDGGKILKHFKAEETIEKERHHLIYSEEVTFDSKGVINRTIGEGTDFWKNLLDVARKKQAKDEIFNFYFTLSEVEVPCENQNEEVYHTEFRKGHVFPDQSISSGTYAILAEQPHGVGKFVDKDKKELDAIVQYTDQTFIALHLYKGFENEIDQTIYEIHLYENQKGDDKFIESYNIVAHETEIVNYIQLPTSSAAYGSSTHVKDKGNEKNPRLFYFILYTWKKEDPEAFNCLKGQPAQKRDTYSDSNKLKFRVMYPENLGVKSQNDSSIIELEEEDKAQYIAKLKKKKAEKKRKQELNQENMASAIERMNDRGDEFRKKYAPFIQIYEQLDREIKAIDQEIQTLSAYNARIARNNAKMSEGRKGVKNYFKQLKLAVNPIYNEVQNRNKKRVPVKVESGAAQVLSTNKVGCPNCRSAVTPEQLKPIFPDAIPDTLQQVAEAYTKYMEYFSLDTCRKKAYFFAAASVEAGTSILGRYHSTEEDLYYSRLSLLRNFPSTFFSGSMVYNAEAKKKVWQSDVYVAQSGDSNYQKHDWYATVNRNGTVLYVQTEDDKKGYENRIFKTKALWDKVVYFDSFEGVRQDKSKAIAGFIYKDKNGNTSEEDGVNYRGSGLIQITGRGVYDNIQREIKDVINKDITSDIMTKSGSVKVRDNLEIGTLTGMGYFAMKKLNWLIHKLPRNGESDTDTEALEVWSAIGNNTSDGSYTKKTNAYKNKASAAFFVPDCTAHKSITPSSVSDVEIITYEMYYHALETDRYIKKIIPKEGNNKNPDYRKYVYIDKNNKRHELCVLRVKIIPKVSYTGKVDAKGRIYTSDPNDRIEMIENIMQFTGYDEGGDGVDRLVVKFREDHATGYQRYGINPDFLAPLLGAICYMNCDYVSFNGASSYKGYPNPSKEHLNGGICDLGYVPKNRNLHRGPLYVTDLNFDVEKQIEFNEALHRYGFARGKEKMFSWYFPYKGDPSYKLSHTTPMENHHHHLHVRGLDYSLIIIEQRQ